VDRDESRLGRDPDSKWSFVLIDRPRSALARVRTRNRGGDLVRTSLGHDGRDWQWVEQIPLRLLVSVATTPYAWFFDQVVLLPAVLQAAARVSARPVRKWLGPALAYIGINVLTLGLILVHRTLFWYVWTASSWLLLYLVTMRRGATLRDRFS